MIQNGVTATPLSGKSRRDITEEAFRDEKRWSTAKNCIKTKYFLFCDPKTNCIAVHKVISTSMDYESHKRVWWDDFPGVHYLSPQVAELKWSDYIHYTEYKCSNIYSTSNCKWHAKLDNLLDTDPANWKFWSNVRDTYSKKKIKWKSERKAIQIIELLTGLVFTSTWLDMNGRRMQLDGYNAEHKIAIEYQGKQHVSHVRYFHRNKIDFIKQQRRDALKKIYCAENDITLIEIPHYLTHKSSDEEWIEYLSPLIEKF
jgi:hypothetical protein